MTPPQQVCAFHDTLARVPIDCTTTDGKTGTSKIANEAFDLEQGALFLVSSTASKPAIEQLALSRLNLRSGEEP